MPKVLIVDDDIDLLEGQKLFLEGKGYRVETAASMNEGLAKLKSFMPDIIFADLMMEHYDTGFVFCKKVKDNPETKNVPIIMQTAASRETGFAIDIESPDKREWIKVDEIVAKPVQLDMLEGKIKQYLLK
ncbi:MAG: response regulator [Spirochaetales bacterium]|nr:response regulator [Spirochaetales bacterium]